MKYLFVIVCTILLLSNCFDPSTNQNALELSLEKKYLLKGETIAASTFSTLGSNLQKAMKEGGVPNAVKYCNIAASPLVDSLMQVHKATIKRTSLRTRNPNNKPNKEERLQLQAYQKQFNAGDTLKPVVEKNGSQVAFYAPIHVMGLCENCHGQLGTTLKEDDYAFIQDLYPSDEATNYTAGDLRGMWSITFKK